jgi:hypothetical protein
MKLARFELVKHGQDPDMAPLKRKEKKPKPTARPACDVCQDGAEEIRIGNHKIPCPKCKGVETVARLVQ